jgi:hypothetical protein
VKERGRERGKGELVREKGRARVKEREREVKNEM